MSGKNGRKHPKKSAEKSAPAVRLSGMSEEEYEDYLDALRFKKQQEEIEAERRRVRQKLHKVGEKLSSGQYVVRKKKKTSVDKISPAETIKRTAKKADEKIWMPVSDAVDAFFTKISGGLCRIAGKKYGILLFIVFSFAVIAVNNYACGLDPFKLSHHVAEGTYQYYLCDYSCGFVSRVLIGAIVTHFTNSVSVELISAITSAADILTLVLNAVLIGVGIRYALKKRNNICFFLCLSALACPFISVWCSTNYGLLDVFLFLCFLLAAFFANTRLRIILPALFCALGMCIHYCFMFEFAPAILCVLFFGAFYSEKGKKSYAAGFAFAAIVSAGLFIWFAVFANNYVKCTADEFNAMMYARFVIPDSLKEQLEPYYQLAVSGGSFTADEKQAIKDYLYRENAIYTEYFDHYIFRVFDNTSASDMTGFFANQFAYNERYRKWSETFMYLLLTGPFILYSLIASGKNLGRTKGRKKLPFLAVLAASLQIIPALILSVDTIRFVTSAVISVLYMNYVTEYAVSQPTKEKGRHRGLLRTMMFLFLLVLWGASVVFFRSVTKDMITT